jgi:ABC-type glycerol-3-phosphate transport system substrate-binding protein
MKKTLRLKMTGWIRFILLVILILVLSPACTPVVTAVPSTPTPAAVSTAGDSPKVIPFFTTESDPEQLAVLQKLIIEYQSTHPGVEVDIVFASPASRGRRLLTALASGANLGIFEVEPALMPQWVEAGYILPLDDVVEQIGPDDFAEGSLYRQDGNVYAIPYAISVYGLWIRKDLFEQAAIPIPQNYDELLRAARALTRGEVYGIALPAGQNIASVNYFSIFLWQNGGDYFTCNGDVAFGQPEALEAIKRWATLTKYAPPGYSTWGYGEQIDAFLNGRVAMAVYGGRLGVQLHDTRPELMDKVTVIFPPFGEQRLTLGVWSRFAIASSTQNKEEARDFLQWLASGDRLLRYDMTMPGHMIPALKSARTESLNISDPYIGMHRDWLESFYEWSALTRHPVMHMGTSESEAAPPWAWEVFGTPGVVDTMLQQIALGAAPESAWKDGVTQIESTVAAWKSMHPEWQPPECAP